MEEAIPDLINAIPDLVRDWELKAVVNDTCTIETSHFSDAAKGIRRERVEERWEQQRELGFGSFGVVHLQRCASGPRSGTLRAVKRIRIRPELLSEAEVKVVSRELSAIVKFSHEQYRDCFVRSFGWFYAQSSIFITMEYLSLGDLESRIRNPIPDSEARRICQQVLQGLVFMHRSNIAHRDLKPSNILVQREGPDWWVKLSDFGTSKQIGSTALRTITGTEQYLAPELQNIYTVSDLDLVRDGTYSLAVDIWAVGAIAFRLTTGRLPFELPTSLFRYVQLDDPLPRIDLQTAECLNFVASTMNGSPRRRLTAEEALGSPWIQRSPPVAQSQVPAADAKSKSIAPQIDNAAMSIYSNTWSTINTVTQDERPRSEVTVPNLMTSDETIRQDSLPTLALRPPPPLHQQTDHNLQLKLGESSMTSTQDTFEKHVSCKFKLVKSYKCRELVDSICLSPDGRWLAARVWGRMRDFSDYHGVRVWQFQTPLQLDKFQDLENSLNITWFTFAQNGKYIIVRGEMDEREKLRIWRLNDRDRFEKAGKDDGIGRRVLVKWRYGSSSQASPDGQMLVEVKTKPNTGLFTYEVSIWKMRSSFHKNNYYQKVQDISDYITEPGGFYWSPDGQAFLETPNQGFEDTATRLWKLGEDGRFYPAIEVPVKYSHTPWVAHMCRKAKFSPDGRWVVIWDTGEGGDNLLKLYEVGQHEMKEADLIHPVIPKPATIQVAFSPDSQIMAMSHDAKGVTIWKIFADNEFIPVTTLHGKKPSDEISLAFSPDGKFLVGGSCETIHVWEIS